jgi:hypothetical protein
MALQALADLVCRQTAEEKCDVEGVFYFVDWRYALRRFRPNIVIPAYDETSVCGERAV